MTYAQMQETANFLKAKLADQADGFTPKYGIILGTGLGGLVEEIEESFSIDYADIPHFPLATVEFHSGKLIFGQIKSVPIVAMKGRFHYYEGYNMKQVTFPVRVMKLLGIEKLFVSNAAGGLLAEQEKGDLMIINDHINLQYENPLTGQNIDQLGDRFPNMVEPYNLSMVEKGLSYAKSKNYRCEAGVYVSVPGPNLETKAEYVYLNKIGADAVGMSTVPEVIVAAHMAIPVFAISVITDVGYPPERVVELSIAEILEIAGEAEPKMTDILVYLITLEA